jgi:hypothetical protein
MGALLFVTPLYRPNLKIYVKSFGPQEKNVNKKIKTEIVKLLDTPTYAAKSGIVFSRDAHVSKCIMHSC